jgi:lipopolysaccharide export system protein LptA
MKDGFKNKTSILSFLLFVAISFIGIPQTPPGTEEKVTKIYVENADTSSVPKDNNFNIQILWGNVKFRQDSTFMYCDSAYLNSLENTLDAFGHVIIKQGDTLSIFGDYMKYDANTKLAELRNHVRMENNNVTLITDSFNYDRELNIGYYFDGGMLLDSLNELTSTFGEYHPDTKMAIFEEKVRLINPQFVLTSDSLEYNTDTKLAYLVSPSVIESDSGIVYSDKGWYNTEYEKSMLYNRSTVVSKDKTKTITADSLFYDKTNGLTEAFGNMFMNDTAKKIIITGNYGYYEDYTKFAFATDSAQLIEYSQKDSLFLHSDTMKMQTIDEEREIRAYYGVRFYRIDFQGVCDSMQFNTADSMLYMYKNPVLWNTGYQIFGDTIKILINDSTIERMYVKDFSFAIQEIDTAHHNQLKGKFLTAFFRAGEMYLIDVKGNAESIYYPIEEKDGSYIALFKSVGSFMSFDIKDRKPVVIKWLGETEKDLLPIPDLTPKDKFLEGYINFNYLRPKDQTDIFTKTVMKKEDITEPRITRPRRQQAKQSQQNQQINPIEE